MLKMKKLNKCCSSLNNTFTMTVAIAGILGCVAISVVYIIFSKNKKF